MEKLLEELREEQVKSLFKHIRGLEDTLSYLEKGALIITLIAVIGWVNVFLLALVVT